MAKMKPQIDSTIVETQSEQNSNQNLGYNEILNRLDKLEAENKALKEGKEDETKNERYTGPKHYSFKIFDGKPVLDYTSFKKDNTRDWKYKALNGQEIVNHWLKLKLFDTAKNEEVFMDVSIDNFYDGFTRSEYQLADKTVKVIDNKEVIFYTFTNPIYGMFTVNENSIN